MTIHDIYFNLIYHYDDVLQSEFLENIKFYLSRLALSLILLPGVVEDIHEAKLGLQMTKHDRIIIIFDLTFEIMKISLLCTELFNFPKRGTDLAENRLESTL